MSLISRVRDVFGHGIGWDIAVSAWGYLSHYGHLPADPKDVTIEDIVRGVRWLAKAMGRIEATDQQTAKAVLEGMFNLHRCGCPDFLRAEAVQGRWGKRELTYGLILPVVSGVSVERQKALMAENFAATSAVCNLKFHYASPGETIDLRLFAVRIDGAGKVLGQQYLPNGGDQPLRGELDTGERWDESLFARVQKHEQCGHGCGLNHNNDPGNLMNPFLSDRLEWGPTDRRELVALYGPPVASTPAPTPTPPTPSPAPVPPTSGDTALVVTEAIQPGTYRLVKMAGPAPISHGEGELA